MVVDACARAAVRHDIEAVLLMHWLLWGGGAFVMILAFTLLPAVSVWAQRKGKG